MVFYDLNINNLKFSLLSNWFCYVILLYFYFKMILIWFKNVVLVDLKIILIVWMCYMEYRVFFVLGWVSLIFGFYFVFVIVRVKLYNDFDMY